MMSSRFAGVLGVTKENCHTESATAQSFTKHAVCDAVTRSEFAVTPVVSSQNWAAEIANAAEKANTNRVVTPWAPLGDTATRLDTAKDELSKSGIHLDQTLRPYDAVTWPHATKGFFKLRKKIPKILTELGIAQTP